MKRNRSKVDCPNADTFKSPPKENIGENSRTSRSSLVSVNSFRSPADLGILIPRKRKRRDSNASLVSLDLNKMKPDLEDKLHGVDGEVPKRKRSLAKVASIASMLSPIKPVKKMGHALQRSLSFKGLLSPVKQPSGSTYRTPAPTPAKHRPNKQWSDTMSDNVRNSFTEKQIQRQEAMFELLRGEEDLIEDLNMVKKTYCNSMRQLHLMTEDELNVLFGMIDEVIPLHEELVEKLYGQRQNDGITDYIGKVMVNWLPSLKCYINICANQIYAKSLLDEKKNDASVNDFLNRCQQSPFSRRLDLWSFLDVPRNRIVRYPLLLKTILQMTPSNHEDITYLNEAIKILDDIIAEMDQKTGEYRCKFAIEHLDYLDEKQEDPLISQCKMLHCEGTLKNNRGTKLKVFLFETILVLTRPATRNGVMCYQVYRQPIPAKHLVLEDVKDGEMKIGSFRNTLGGKEGKNVFRVSFVDPTMGQSHTLQANDEHDKRQWMACLNTVVVAHKPHMETYV